MMFFNLFVHRPSGDRSWQVVSRLREGVAFPPDPMIGYRYAWITITPSGEIVDSCEDNSFVEQVALCARIHPFLQTPVALAAIQRYTPDTPKP